MARKMNLNTLEQKIEKAQQDVVKTRDAYNAATARLKELLDKRDALKKEEICFLQVQIPEICRQKWRILHLRFGESCRLPGRIA